jgi:TolA-binding protein
MGEDYLLLKKTKDALRAFLDVSEQYTEFPLLVERGLLGQGECYERLREKKKARDMYQRVVETAVDPQIKKDAEERLKRLR